MRLPTYIHLRQVMRLLRVMQAIYAGILMSGDMKEADKYRSRRTQHYILSIYYVRNVIYCRSISYVTLSTVHLQRNDIYCPSIVVQVIYAGIVMSGNMKEAEKYLLAEPFNESTAWSFKDVCTLHPTSYTLRLTPDTRHLTPYTLHPTPYTLHPTPYTLRPSPYTLHPTPYTVVVQRRMHTGFVVSMAFEVRILG